MHGAFYLKISSILSSIFFCYSLWRTLTDWPRQEIFQPTLCGVASQQNKEHSSLLSGRNLKLWWVLYKSILARSSTSKAIPRTSRCKESLYLVVIRSADEISRRFLMYFCKYSFEHDFGFTLSSYLVFHFQV